MACVRFEWLERWVPIDRADRAVALAGRLAVEAGPDHPLYGIPVETVGRGGDRDDVLYRLLDGTGRVAVVHLTWTASPPERYPYPWTTLYPSFEAWAADGMTADRRDHTGGGESHVDRAPASTGDARAAVPDADP